MVCCRLSVWRGRSLWLSVLLLIFVLGAILRSYHLGFSRLETDESFSWRLTQYSSEELIRRTAADVHPPLYYLLLQAWTAGLGSSPAALRGLSVLFGVLCIPMMYLVCLESFTGVSKPPETSSRMPHLGALFSAFLVAVHVTQVVPGRTARMYSLGVFLAGLTGWLLLRALRATRRQVWWWTGYGVAVAAFCYTHYYAFFTVFAQVLFAIVDLLIRARKHSYRQFLTSAAYFVFGEFVAFSLYAIWLPNFFTQVHIVHRGYWIPSVAVWQIERVFFDWSTGVGYFGLQELCLWLVLLSSCIAWRVYRCDRAACFFLLQAALPWLFSLAISVYGGRPIFLQRYLAFAHLSLLAFWGLILCRLPGWLARLSLICLLGTACSFGLWDTASQWQVRSSVMSQTAHFLKEHYRADDIILTERPSSDNLLRYYIFRAGLKDLKIHCLIDPADYAGHIPHLASLEIDEILLDERGPYLESVQRIWRASQNSSSAEASLPGMSQADRSTFQDGDGYLFTLVLYERLPR